jgi:hypothetical protein
MFENHGVEHNARVLEVAVAKTHEMCERHPSDNNEAHKPGVVCMGMVEYKMYV